MKRSPNDPHPNALEMEQLCEGGVDPPRRTNKNPRKLTGECRTRLLEAIKAGNYASVAAAYAGIHPATFFRWMKRGREAADGPYRELFDEVCQAHTYAEIRAVAIIQKRMEDKWQAAVAYLERKFPHRWGRNRSLPAASPTSNSQREPFDDNQLRQILGELQQAGAIDADLADAADPATA